MAVHLLEYLDKRLGRHSGNGPEFHFYCPACIDKVGSDGDTRKFTINLTRQRGQCWRCEFKFRDIRYLFRYINGGFVTVEEEAMLRRDPPIVNESIVKTVRSILMPPKSNVALRYPRLPVGTQPLTKEICATMPFKRGLQYMRKRGFSLEDALRFDVHYCPSGAHTNHLIFPVYQGGERVYWTTRYAGSNPPEGAKSKNPVKRDGYVSRQHVLLGYDDVIGVKQVALVEGPFDRMAPPAAIASLGKEFSPFQVRLIEGLVDQGLEELVLMYDEGTTKKTDEIRASLYDVVPRLSTMYLGKEDPADLKDELVALMEDRVDRPSLSRRLRARFNR